MKPALDPITLEIMFNGLRSITDETYIALTRSAYSTNIKERRDCSTALFDADGRLVPRAQLPLAFSVGKTELGPLTGAACDLGKGEPRVVSKELGLRWTPK